MCDRLAFMEMTEAEKAAVIAEYAHLERMLADRRADDRARAERFTARAFSTAARSGQVTPSPADTAARGDLIEARA